MVGQQDFAGRRERSPDATRLIAAETLVVKTSRVGTVPRNAASRSRASQRSGGTWRTKKSVGSAASRPAEFRHAVEDRPRQRAERAGVEVDDRRVEHHPARAAAQNGSAEDGGSFVSITTPARPETRLVREPPYPPPPRHAPPDLGRRGEGPPALRAVGIAGHLLGVLLYAVAPPAAAVAAVAFLRAEETHLIVRTGGFAVCTVLAFLLAKSLLPRRLPLPPGVIPVRPDDQPTAYAFVGRVAADLGVAAPRRS